MNLNLPKPIGTCIGIIHIHGLNSKYTNYELAAVLYPQSSSFCTWNVRTKFNLVPPPPKKEIFLYYEEMSLLSPEKNLKPGLHNKVNLCVVLRKVLHNNVS